MSDTKRVEVAFEWNRLGVLLVDGESRQHLNEISVSEFRSAAPEERLALLADGVPEEFHEQLKSLLEPSSWTPRFSFSIKSGPDQ